MRNLESRPGAPATTTVTLLPVSAEAGAAMLRTARIGIVPPAPPAAKSPALKPSVPPVPESPIRSDCARLPTQVERDTCTNRKESTG